MIIAWGLFIFGILYTFALARNIDELRHKYGSKYWLEEKYQFLVKPRKDLIPALLALCSAQYIWG